MIKFNEQEFLDAIKSSFSHKEAKNKLGYIGGSHLYETRYGKLFNKLNPNISHFENRFNECEFLLAISTSQSHTEASKKLGYKLPKSPANKTTLYSKLFNLLLPDISHFRRKSNLKFNIPHKSKSKEYRKLYIKLRMVRDIQFKLKVKLRSRLSDAIKNNYKSGSAIRDLGCSVEKFKLWLEMLWADGMSWDNYGKDGWVIDHVKPLSSFNLDNKSEFLKACHFSNLQPLWAKDNLIKSDKI